MKNFLLCPDLTLAWEKLITSQQGHEPPCEGHAYGCMVRAEGKAGKRELSSSMSVFLVEMWSGVPGGGCLCVRRGIRVRGNLLLKSLDKARSCATSAVTQCPLSEGP